jgi:hypothetical protein
VQLLLKKKKHKQAEQGCPALMVVQRNLLTHKHLHVNQFTVICMIGPNILFPVALKEVLSTLKSMEEDLRLLP